VPVNFFHRLYNGMLMWSTSRVFSGFFQGSESGQRSALHRKQDWTTPAWLGIFPGCITCVSEIWCSHGHLLFSIQLLQLMTLWEYHWHTAAVSDNYNDKFCCCQSQCSLSRTNVTALTEHTMATRGYLSCRPFVGHRNAAWHLSIANNCLSFLEVCS